MFIVKGNFIFKNVSKSCKITGLMVVVRLMNEWMFIVKEELLLKAQIDLC